MIGIFVGMVASWPFIRYSFLPVLHYSTSTTKVEIASFDSVG
jgi:hypothetical protein